MFRRRKRNTETYTTSDWDGARPHQAPKNPVVAIGVRPDGPIYRLDDIQDCYGPKKWISIGSGDDNDIQLHEKIPRGKRRSISWNHCELCRTPQGRVMVKQCEDAYNTTKVNGARVRGGMVELGPGDVLAVGPKRLTGISANGNDPLRITANDPPDYVRRVVRDLGTMEKAAEFFDVHFSTVSRWLKKALAHSKRR